MTANIANTSSEITEFPKEKIALVSSIAESTQSVTLNSGLGESDLINLAANWLISLPAIG